MINTNYSSMIQHAIDILWKSTTSNNLKQFQFQNMHAYAMICPIRAPCPNNQFAAQVSHCIPKGIQQLHLLRIIAPRSPKAMRCTNADVAGPVWPRTCQEKVNSNISSYGVHDSKLETPDRKPELVNHRGSELAKGQISRHADATHSPRSCLLNLSTGQ